MTKRFTPMAYYQNQFEDKEKLVDDLITACLLNRFPPELLKYLLAALAAYREGHYKTIDEALGLRQPGRNSRAYSRLKRRRDDKIRRVWGLMGDVSPWQRSQRLAKCIRRFQSTKWKTYRQRDVPPDHFTELDRLLFSLFKLGAVIPQTAEGLHVIVKPNN